MTDYTKLNAGMYNSKGYKLSCILDEGNITVGTARNAVGASMVTYAFANEMQPGDLVALDVSDAATFELAKGSVIVKKLIADGSAFGMVLTDIDWNQGLRPTESVTGTMAERIALGYYRIATIEVFPNIMIIKKAVLTGTNITKIIPGDSAKLVIDIDNQTAGGFYVKDVANGGSGLIALHAVPLNTGDTYNLLVGITGPVVGDKA